MTFTEARLALARRLNIDYATISSNKLVASADIDEWLETGQALAWDYRMWSFTEDTKQVTSVDDSYYDYPHEFEDESISRLTVAGEKYEKLNFEDYQKWKQDYPSDTTKYWSEHKRFYFINQNAYTVGDEINVTGKLRATKLSDGADLLCFSYGSDDYENSGNKAIIRLAYAEALDSEKYNKPNEALKQREMAFGMLNTIWEPIGARRANEHTKNRPFFEVPDFFSRGNGRSTNIGNFP